MKSATMTKFIFITCLVIGLSMVLPTDNAFAQAESPAALTETPPPATPTNTTVPTATNTPGPGTPTAIPTNTPGPGTATPTNTPVTNPPTPVPSRPVPIPEPVTVVLFGTGLAALSAAVASRRKKDN